MDAVAYALANQLQSKLNDAWIPGSKVGTTEMTGNFLGWEPTASEVGGKIYVIGGKRTNPLADNECFDPVTKTFTKKAPMPTPREQALAGVIDGKIYVVGGIGPGFVSTNECYDPLTNTWQTKTARPNPIAAQSGGVYKGKLYSTGGYNSTILPTNMYAYDPISNAWETKANCLLSRYRAVSGFARGKMIIAGGYSPTDSSILTRTEQYDPDTNTWLNLSVYPSMRIDHYASACVSAGPYLFTHGGKTSGGTGTGILYIFDPFLPGYEEVMTRTSFEWRAFHAGAIVGNKLYLFGGGNPANSAEISSVYSIEVGSCPKDDPNLKALMGWLATN